MRPAADRAGPERGALPRSRPYNNVPADGSRCTLHNRLPTSWSGSK